MDGSSDKRRLKLMNEALPAPTPQASLPNRGSVRERTLRRAERLLALTVAGAATQAGCATAPPQPTVDIPGSNNGGVKEVPGTGTVKSKPSVQATAEPPDPGYGVVDPMPPPPRCPGVATAATATAVWKKDKKGDYLEIKLGKTTLPGAQYDTSQPSNAWNGTLENVALTATGGTFNIRPTPGVTNIGVAIPALCSQGQSHVQLEINLTSGTKQPPAVNLSDSW
jgi:hypothetical protein